MARKPLLIFLFILITVLLAGCGPIEEPQAAASVTAQETIAPASVPEAAPSPSPAASALETGKLIGILKDNAKRYVSMSFQYRVIEADGTVSAGTVWRLNGKAYKVELGNESGVLQVSIVNLTDKVSVTYSPDAKTGIKAALTEAEAAAFNFNSSDMNALLPADYLDALSDDTAEDLGNETLNGEECRVLRYADEKRGRENKLWISLASNMPVRLTTAAETGGERQEIEITGIQYGPAPAGTFEVPGNVKLTDYVPATPSPSQSPGGTEQPEPTDTTQPE